MTQIEVEEVLSQAKAGIWNVKMVVLSLLGCLISSAAYIFPSILLAELPYDCSSTYGQLSNVTYSADQCFYTVNGTTTKCDSFAFKPSEEFKTTFVSEFDLVCEKKYLRVDYSVSIMMAGQMLSTFFCNIMMDKFGRKSVFVFSSAMCALCALLYILSPTIWIVLLIQLAESFFLISSYVAGFVLISESLPPRYRIIGTNGAEYSYGFGVALGAFISLIFPVWEFYVYARLLIPAIICSLLAFVFMDESPKWLLQKKRYKDVSKLIRKIFKLNKTPLPRTLEERLSELEESSNRDSKQISLIDQVRSVPFWRLFRTRKTALWNVIFAFDWVTCVAVYYGLLFSPKFFKVQVHYFFIIDGFCTIPACGLQYFLANHYGRKPCNIISLSLTTICLIVGPFLPEHGAWMIARYIIACSSFLFITSAFSTVYIWHGEIMPTDLRAIGIGIGSLTGRFASIFITHLLIWFAAVWSKLPVFFLASLALISAVCSFFIPETNRQIMPDTIEEYECFGTPEYVKMKEKRQAMSNKAVEVNV